MGKIRNEIAYRMVQNLSIFDELMKCVREKQWTQRKFCANAKSIK